MSEVVSFKARVAETVSKYAFGFQSVFVDYEYLVCSPAFTQNPYYIVSAKQDNYMHLTGVPFQDSQLFFNKCLHGTLTEKDISFAKHGQSESEVKGSVRRKITVLPNLIEIFSAPLLAEESFSKNRIICSFGKNDGICTVGFTLTSGNHLIVRPMTLLYGAELDKAKADVVNLILRRKSGESLFDTVVQGGKEHIEKSNNAIRHLLSQELRMIL